MPELQLFGRRWHISSDTFPVVAFILAVIHKIWLIPFIVGAYDLESTGLRTSCQDANLLRAALYGMLVLFAVSSFNESTIVAVGLRGGPLETGKRRAVTKLLYVEVLLWWLLLGWTVFGTYVVASPNIGEDCWIDDPCVATEASCETFVAPASATLSSACQALVDNQVEYFNCQRQWTSAAVSWHYHGDCNHNETMWEWLNTRDGSRVYAQLGGTEQSFVSTVRRNPRYLVDHEYVEIILRALDVAFDPTDPFTTVPWFNATTCDPPDSGSCRECTNATCKGMARLVGSCTEWDLMLQLPQTSDKKDFFVAMIYSSWGCLFLTWLVLFLAFNLTPDYTRAESWEGTVHRLARCLCCQRTLELADKSVTVEQEASGGASKEIAKSLHMLFGGIDLDPTDRLLGVLLVSKEQHRRRRCQAVHVLHAAGALSGSTKRGLVQGVAAALKSALAPARGWGPAGAPPAAGGGQLGSMQGVAAGGPVGGEYSDEGGDVEPEVDEECPQAVPLQPPSGGSSLGSGSQRQLSQAGSGGLQPPAAASSSAVGASPGSRALLLHRRTLLRLRTLLAGPSRHLQGEPAGDGGSSTGEGSSHGSSGSGGSSGGHGGRASSGGGWGGGESAPRLVAAGGQDNGSYGEGGGGNGGTQGSEQQQEVAIRIEQEYQPLLTPVPLPRRLAITPQEAANLYTGHQDPVPKSVLEEAQQMSRFAVAAYGLQGRIWAKGKKPPMCLGNINLLLGCFSKPLALDHTFRRHNFNAIREITGVAPTDLLYVSYANAPGGPLPYMLMLHRPSKSVVLSVRGTVGMEDLVTDLLSTPVDIGSWLPAWVHEANASGEPMYAHAGIVSSTTAILKDLEKHGLLQELLRSQLVRTASGKTGQGAASAAWSGAAGEEPGGDWGEQGDDEVQLPVARAQSVIHTQLAYRGWQVVVTGHSLGAAVACLLSFHLRDSFPDLRCWAFCPPGGLLSWNLSRIAQTFCTSVAVGKDLISRLSFSTARRLVDDMVTCLARCKRPKLKVLADILLWRRRRDLHPLTFCPYREISDEVVRALEGYYRSSQLHAGGQAEMFPPGRLVFMRPFKGRRPEQAVWDAVWVEAPALIGEGILVSPAMMSHHRMFTLEDAFRSVFAGEVAEQAQRGEDGPGSEFAGEPATQA